MMAATATMNQSEALSRAAISRKNRRIAAQVLAT